MENLPTRIPYSLFPRLVRAFVPPDTPPDAELELVIVIEGENIPAREFAEYLALIDRIYGRLSSDNLRKYSRRHWGRLQIAEIHKSELEIIFRTLYGHMDTATYIVIVLFLRSLFLKGIPQLIKVTTEGAKTLADTYKAYEEGKAISEDTRHKEIVNRYDEERLFRENRKQIREVIQQEPALADLDDTRKGQLIGLLDRLAQAESRHLPAPIRFAHSQVKKVLMRLRKPGSGDAPIVGGHERKFKLGTSEDEK